MNQEITPTEIVETLKILIQAEINGGYFPEEANQLSIGEVFYVMADVLSEYDDVVGDYVHHSIRQIATGRGGGT